MILRHYGCIMPLRYASHYAIIAAMSPFSFLVFYAIDATMTAFSFSASILFAMAIIEGISFQVLRAIEYIHFFCTDCSIR